MVYDGIFAVCRQRCFSHSDGEHTPPPQMETFTVAVIVINESKQEHHLRPWQQWWHKDELQSQSLLKTSCQSCDVTVDWLCSESGKVRLVVGAL